MENTATACLAKMPLRLATSPMRRAIPPSRSTSTMRPTPSSVELLNGPPPNDMPPVTVQGIDASRRRSAANDCTAAGKQL